MTQEEVKAKFDYRPDGRLTFRERCGSAHKGKASGCVDSRGYRQTRVNGVLQLDHRIIYLWHHGFLPEFLDHINGNRLDNRVENLRPVTKVQNSHNSKRRSNNKSGVRGVNWHKQHRKWYANIRVDGKSKFLGLFTDLADAKAARESAELELLGEYSPLARHR